jgi:hypothetical protein
MSPEESRENFLDATFTKEQIDHLKEIGDYDRYITGVTGYEEICKHARDQGV